MLKNLGVLAALMVVTSCRSSTEALLVRVDSEAVGDNCANGGAALRTGYDANNSGTLDDTEVDASKTKYVCNGATGTAGQTGQNGEQGDAGVRGLNSLNKVSMEAAGTNCANGGSKIETGLDVNDNGTLEASEVTATSYVCSQSAADDYYFGDIVIRSDDDLDELDGKRVVFGNITIEHATGGVFTLPDLEAVVGDISLGESFGGEIGVPAVRALTPVRELHFPKLVTVTGFYVSAYEALTRVDVPVLARVGSLRFEYLNTLTTLSFPQLTRADTFSIRETEALTSVSAPLLTRTSVFELEYNYVLATVTVPATLAATRELDVYGNELLNDCFARALRFNDTPEWGVDISDNLP
ncbi:MAG: DUF7151 family protein, partial [Archangium sp.]